MTIKVTKNGEVIYSQLVDDSKTLNAVIGHLMQQPTGKDVTTLVSNNGHDMTFSNAEFPLEPLVRKVNGILQREKKATQ